MSLLAEMNERAFDLGIPLTVHIDVTYRCNERCVHCYLDHDDHGEMSLPEIKNLLDQLADAGVFFLTLSGGEVLMRIRAVALNARDLGLYRHASLQLRHQLHTPYQLRHQPTLFP